LCFCEIVNTKVSSTLWHAVILDLKHTPHTPQPPSPNPPPLSEYVDKELINVIGIILNIQTDIVISTILVLRTTGFCKRIESFGYAREPKVLCDREGAMFDSGIH